MKNSRIFVLLFEVNSKLLGALASSISEVSFVTNMTKIPTLPKPVIGFMNYHGEIATLVDLGEFLFKEQSKGNIAILTKYNGDLLGFLVDTVYKVLHVGRDEFVKTSVKLPEEIKKYAIGEIIYEQNVVPILDFREIISDISKKRGA